MRINPTPFPKKPPTFHRKQGAFCRIRPKHVQDSSRFAGESRGEPRKTLSDKPLEYGQNAAKNAYSL